jgi:mono/diheme cytochrome c family protein
MLIHSSRKALAESVLLAALTLASAHSVAAEDAGEFERGKSEYMAACAACHGEAADGNGPIATMFKERVPDLRKIAAANDGVFPFLDIFHIVDGRTEVRAHGNPMPVFGNRYTAEAEEHGTLFGTETQARARVTELVLYLQSIQE